MVDLNKKLHYFIFGLSVIPLSCVAVAQEIEPQTPEASEASAAAGAITGPFERITSIAFGPDNILFVGDTTQATVTAVDVGVDANYEDAHFNLYAIDALLASHFGVPGHMVTIGDLAVHPVSAEVYVAVSQTTTDRTTSTVVKVTAEGSVSEVDFANARRHSLKNPISDAVTFWGQIAGRDYAITDMDYADGYLYVAGLSNAEFASTLHKIPVPFDGSEEASSIGIYHGVHGQTETRAPIVSQEVVELAGKDYMLAVYLCTPLVLIPLDEITDGAHITGKTIGELGFGNTPIDLVRTQVKGFGPGKAKDTIVITNHHIGTKTIEVKDLVKAAKSPGITKRVKIGKVAGVPFETVPMSTYATTAAQGKDRLLNVYHNPTTGRIDLLSRAIACG